MGIQDLIGMIEDNAKDYAIRPFNFERFQGWKITIDTSLMMHKTVKARRAASGEDLVNESGMNTSHLHGIFYKCITFLDNDIVPIFVFDGKSAPIKSVTCKKRSQLRKEAERKLAAITDKKSQEYRRLFAQVYRPSREEYDELRIMLDLMGIPYINAPEEADPVCAWLTRRRGDDGKRLVDAVCSDDSDMIPLGARYLLKDMCGSLTRGKMINMVSYRRVKKGLGLDRNGLIDASVLLGTDYCERIKGIGKKRVMGVIRKHKTLENFLEHLEESSGDSEEFECIRENIQCMREAVEYFRAALDRLDDPDFFQIRKSQVNLRQCQQAELLDFLCIKHGFNVCNIQPKVNALVKHYRETGVTRPNRGVYHIISGEKIVPMRRRFHFISDDEEEDDGSSPLKESDDEVPSGPGERQRTREQEPPRSSRTKGSSRREDRDDDHIPRTKEVSKRSTRR